jgi:hypothetical protein
LHISRHRKYRYPIRHAIACKLALVKTSHWLIDERIGAYQDASLITKTCCDGHSFLLEFSPKDTAA